MDNRKWEDCTKEDFIDHIKDHIENNKVTTEKHDYSIEYLEKTFAIHAKESKESLERNKILYKKMFPDEEYKPDEWCLPEALLTIVREIRALKEAKHE